MLSNVSVQSLVHVQAKQTSDKDYLFKINSAFFKEKYLSLKECYLFKRNACVTRSAAQIEWKCLLKKIIRVN